MTARRRVRRGGGSAMTADGDDDCGPMTSAGQQRRRDGDDGAMSPRRRANEDGAGGRDDGALARRPDDRVPTKTAPAGVTTARWRDGPTTACRRRPQAGRPGGARPGCVGSNLNAADDGRRPSR